MTNVSSTVTKIGTDALSAKDPMVILFDEEATALLEKVSVIQKFQSPDAQKSLDLKVGDTISFDGVPYMLHQVGQLVQPNLTSIGHVTLIFRKPTKDDHMQNAVYLTNPKEAMPQFKVGTNITYQF